MIKGLNNNKLELCPRCGHNCERMCSQLERFLIIPNSITKERGGNGPKGQKQFIPNNAFALTGRNKYASSFTQGVALGCELLPLRGEEMPQRERLIELNKIAIQQMKVLEGVEERRMLK